MAADRVYECTAVLPEAPYPVPPFSRRAAAVLFADLERGERKEREGSPQTTDTKSIILLYGHHGTHLTWANAMLARVEIDVICFPGVKPTLSVHTLRIHNHV